MFGKTIFINSLAVFLSIIFIFSIFFLYTTYRIAYKNNLASLESRLIEAGMNIKENHRKDIININKDNLKKIFLNIRDKSKINISLFDANGELITGSEDENISNNKSYKKKFIEAMKNKIGKSIGKDHSTGLEVLFITIPNMHENKIISILSLEANMEKIGLSKLFGIKHILIYATLLLFSFLMILLFSRQIYIPINELTGAFRKIKENNFDSQLNISLNKNKEYNDLIHSFNDMTVYLKNLFSDLNYRNEELESIITSVSEGIIVIDNSGKIIKANRSFYKIINTKNIIGKYYWEAIRDSEIIEAVNSEGMDKSNSIKEINYENKIFLCSINYLVSKKGHVLILYDITALRNLENVKRDFISNVSHELRTPLTAIKGFAETLVEDERDNDRIKYLNIIIKNSERLTNIVRDLLILTELEKKFSPGTGIEKKLDIEKINLEQLIDSILIIFENRLAKKKLKGSLKLNDNIKHIYGDSYKLEQLFINLIDNAIKYTDQGEIKIAVGKYGDSKIKIEIIDTGIGIPERDIPRLFERFYVVDKSRSRAKGGTGLGLSIVKHIVLLHNGEINISSEFEKGTTITIILPREQK